MRFQTFVWCFHFATMSLLAGCAGNGKGLDQNGQPIGSSSSSSSGSSSSGSGSGGSVTADFQSLQANVFTPICSKCHIGASAPEGLQLDAAHSYNLLVGVSSVEQPALDRIKPGDPDHSYLILKIEGAAGISGGQMPLGETPLPSSTVAAFRQWVMDGASNSQASAMAVSSALSAASNEAARLSFAVESTDPADTASAAAPLRRIVVAFTREVDASLVNDTTVALERLEPASSASPPAAVARTVAAARDNPNVVLVTPSTPLSAGTYRVTLRGTGGGALADVDAHTLGSDVSIVFTVEELP